MRLATWNVNSIRARVDRVADWLERADVDVLAMQETKCSDEQFPTMPFLAAGYDVVHCGFNQWNGVAIASRVGIDDVQVGFDGQPTWSDKPEVEAAAEARALGATCNGVRVWSLYVPNGRFVGSPHYAYKLEWFAALRSTAQQWLTDDPSAQIAMVGDWNIAPTDEDVWSVGPTRAAPTSLSRSDRPSTPSSTLSSVTWYGLSPRTRRIHLLGLHAAAVPEEPRYAHRLHSRITGAGPTCEPRRDRPRGAKR